MTTAAKVALWLLAAVGYVAVIGVLSLVPGVADAQQAMTIPYPATTSGGNKSSSITTTNTFQTVFKASGTAPDQSPPPRHGCTVQNNGTHVMYVFEGAGLTSATSASSVQLTAGQSYNCAVGGVALTGEVDITGTSGDLFYAAQY